MTNLDHILSLIRHGAKLRNQEDGSLMPLTEDFYHHAVEACNKGGYNAATYELVIKDKNGNVICTLVFNANGQLTEIVFAAPARDHSTQASGFSFTVTGLYSGTSYDLTITAKDENGAVLQTTTQSFTTAGGASAVDNVTTGDTRLRKMLIDGQLIILRDGKAYNVTGSRL